MEAETQQVAELAREEYVQQGKKGPKDKTGVNINT